MIEVRDLTKTFGAVEAVRGISFRVDMGEIVGFLGARYASPAAIPRAIRSPAGARLATSRSTRPSTRTSASRGTCASSHA